MRLVRTRPSPALLVSVFALVAAVAGTAVAADPVATSSAINKKKVKKIAKKQANKAVSNALPIGSGELATLDEHTETISVPANTHQGVTAACESGETVVSGGWRWTHTGPSDVEVREDHREGNGWRASGRNDTNSPKELRVHAYCLTAG